MYKPFRPPLPKSFAPKKPVEEEERIPESDDESEPRPYKKRKILVYSSDERPPAKSVPASAGVFAPRKPLIAVKNSSEPKSSSDLHNDCPEGYYLVLWRKYTNKKHKTWDGDGVLSVYGGYARLQGDDGKEMGKCVYKEPLLPGSTLSIGGKEVEVDSIISKDDFLSGRPFLKVTATKPVTTFGRNTTSTPKPPSIQKAPISLPKGKVPLLGKKKADDGSEISEITAKSFYSKTSAIKAQFKNPLLSTTVIPQTEDGAPTPRHNPNAFGAVVMKRPIDCPKGKQIVDVVLDPFLGQHFHPHQFEGVKFMYECVMGMRDFNGQGALLADEMGLGKTLQTIALLWTLLKQNPIAGSNDGVIKKALVVCPVTLIRNWSDEFKRWLGKERLGVIVADNAKTKLTDFTHGKSYSVMIIGYEKLRSVQDELKKGAGIDIIIADEGHRLKTAQNKSAQAIRNLNTPMRVVLTGTPMQNDLSEFFIMVDFVNPGLLGNYKTFKKEFELPIVKSRQPEASKRDVEKGKAREEELSCLTKSFILRRTADVMSKFLPPKSDFVVYCKPTDAQIRVYKHVLDSPFFGNAFGSKQASFQLITLLKKVCNAPSLLKTNEGAPSNVTVAELLQAIPDEIMRLAPVRSSSKFRVLDQMLRQLSKKTNEKIVIVSNWTSTLDLIGQHLASMSLPFSRLDGKTPTDQRQDLVKSFNKAPATKSFAFLLSAKAGGVGINLIGASRLILFDTDWNPATDLQAMARIHRHGQKRPVKIYRFLMAGGIDEKIYQRQVSKMGLADSVVDGKKNEASFSAVELKDLFKLDTTSVCQTHDLLGCDCKGLGNNIPPPDISETSEENLEEEDAEEAVDDSDDEMLVPLKSLVRGAMVPGTKKSIEALERKLADEAKQKRLKKSKGKMQALMLFNHLDTSIFRGETEDVFGDEEDAVTEARRTLDDDVLVDVLKSENCKVSFVFVKHNKARALAKEEVKDIDDKDAKIITIED
ncbi:uncharacterized protein LY89DRAFT_609528 [Mollisia scopiformis]|uniref:Uncharacterized protein n=1 Tax=Mollisia scopiformis TaxID=149040 RepID=A0A194XLU9_MOLSC|nr:uncharacterized protein LY89DRAFT_609528 [Mollisia scopiformis]KUJ21111.1 hypothetical protein LY89DRAFT_609528 [Mollisia scopiformis]